MSYVSLYGRYRLGAWKRSGINIKIFWWSLWIICSKFLWRNVEIETRFKTILYLKVGMKQRRGWLGASRSPDHWPHYRGPCLTIRPCLSDVKLSSMIHDHPYSLDSPPPHPHRWIHQCPTTPRHEFESGCCLVGWTFDPVQQVRITSWSISVNW